MCRFVSFQMLQLVVILITFLNFCESASISSDVEWTTRIQLEDGFEAHWLTTDKEFITMEISAPTTGWVAVGFTDKGAMKGADIVMGWICDKGIPHIKVQKHEGYRWPHLGQHHIPHKKFISKFHKICTKNHKFSSIYWKIKVLYK